MSTVYDKYVGTKINNLTILKIDTKRSFNKTYFICKCDCGTTRRVMAYKVLKEKTKGCQKCKNKKEVNHNWCGYEKLYGKYLYWLQKNSLVRKGDKAEVNVTIKFLWELFEDQQGRCAISGLPITIAKDSYSYKESTASVDRIDSSKGYTVDNIQWVHKDVNRMKSNFSDQRFIEICKTVANYWEEDNT